MQVLKTKSSEGFVIKDFKSRDFKNSFILLLLLSIKQGIAPFLLESNKLVLKITRNHFAFRKLEPSQPNLVFNIFFETCKFILVLLFFLKGCK